MLSTKITLTAVVPWCNLGAFDLLYAVLLVPTN